MNEINRNNWIENKLKNLPAGIRILDAGAGEKQYEKYCKHLHYVSQDFAEYNPLKGDDGLHAINWQYGSLDIISDITTIPEPDNSFDAIICTEVFEHLVDPLAALKEFKRLLRSDGFLILTAPFNSLTHFAPYHYYTGFSRYFYEYHLPKFDFTIMEIEPNGTYFSYLQQEMNRLPYAISKYSHGEISKFDKYLFKIVSWRLGKYNEKDKNSSEMGVYGWHVFAKRN